MLRIGESMDMFQYYLHKIHLKEKTKLFIKLLSTIII